MTTEISITLLRRISSHGANIRYGIERFYCDLCSSANMLAIVLLICAEVSPHSHTNHITAKVLVRTTQTAVVSRWNSIDRFRYFAYGLVGVVCNVPRPSVHFGKIPFHMHTYAFSMLNNPCRHIETFRTVELLA